MKEHALTEAAIEALARRQLADYDARCPGTIFADPEFNPSVADAYRLQIATAGLRVERGEAVAGYKIGCVSATVRKQLNVEHPVFGYVVLNALVTHLEDTQHVLSDSVRG